MRVLACDPGTEESGYIVWDDGVIECGQIHNEDFLKRIVRNDFGGALHFGLECVASYGMAVGKETFETVFWTGRFFERARHFMQVHRVYRKDIKIHLCGTMKAKDGNIRQALIDKHGAPGTKNKRGKTYGVAGHIWSALAVADYVESIVKSQESEALI